MHRCAWQDVLEPSTLAGGIGVPYIRLWKSDAERILQVAEEGGILSLPDRGELRLSKFSLGGDGSTWPGLCSAASNLRAQLFGAGHLASSTLILHSGEHLVGQPGAEVCTAVPGCPFCMFKLYGPVLEPRPTFSALTRFRNRSGSLSGLCPQKQRRFPMHSKTGNDPDRIQPCSRSCWAATHGRAPTTRVHHDSPPTALHPFLFNSADNGAICDTCMGFSTSMDATSVSQSILMAILTTSSSQNVNVLPTGELIEYGDGATFSRPFTQLDNGRHQINLKNILLCSKAQMTLPVDSTVLGLLTKRYYGAAVLGWLGTLVTEQREDTAALRSEVSSPCDRPFRTASAPTLLVYHLIVCSPTLPPGPLRPLSTRR